MKAMTVRGISPSIDKRLRDLARKQGKSINQVILDILQKSLGLEKEPKYTRVYDDMDHLFGKWPQAEFERIQAKIDAERSIDEELWQ
jgi:plasmid stability protein